MAIGVYIRNNLIAKLSLENGNIFWYKNLMTTLKEILDKETLKKLEKLKKELKNRENR